MAQAGDSAQWPVVIWDEYSEMRLELAESGCEPGLGPETGAEGWRLTDDGRVMRQNNVMDHAEPLTRT
jgi:hypothetical protein